MFFNNRFIHFLDRGEGFKRTALESGEKNIFSSESKKEEILPELKALLKKLDEKFNASQENLKLENNSNVDNLENQSGSFLKRRELIVQLIRSLNENKIDRTAVNELSNLDLELKEFFDNFSRTINKKIEDLYNQIITAEKDDKNSLDPELLYPLYNQFRTLWGIALNPPSIDHNIVIDLCDKAEDFYYRKDLKRILSRLPFLPFLREQMQDFYLGFYDEFKTRGKNIGEFVAQFYKNPVEVTKTIYNYLKEYLMTDTDVLLKKIGIYTYDEFRKWLSDTLDEKGINFAYDMGKTAGIACLLMGSSAIGKVGIPSSPLFVAAHADKAIPSLKSFEEINEASKNLVSILFKKNKLNLNEMNLISNKVSSYLNNLSITNRDRIYESVLKYFLSEERELPDLNDLNFSKDFLIECLYDKETIKKLGDKKICKLLISISSQKERIKGLKLSESEIQLYADKGSILMIQYLKGNRSLIAFARDNFNKSPDSLYSRLENIRIKLHNNKLPQKEEIEYVLKTLTGFRYYLKDRIKNPEEEKKTFYAFMHRLNQMKST